MVILLLCVRVAVYPAPIAILLIVIAALIVEALFPLPSKNTSSLDPGTEALFAPPDVAAQFVFPVAFQLADAPPPTQYLSEIVTHLLILVFGLLAP